MMNEEEEEEALVGREETQESRLKRVSNSLNQE